MAQAKAKVRAKAGAAGAGAPLEPLIVRVQVILRSQVVTLRLQDADFIYKNDNWSQFVTGSG